jgi:uncharacterized protein (DUF2141 family)
MSKAVGYLFHQLLTTLNINYMLRVFITVILYLISFFTQGQENSRFEQKDFSLSSMALEDYGSSNKAMTFGPPSFEESKFEVMDKDLTFEIKL